MQTNPRSALIEARNALYTADDSFEAVIDNLYTYANTNNDSEIWKVIGELSSLRNTLMQTYYTIADKLNVA